jgi:hypothetical protein
MLHRPSLLDFHDSKLRLKENGFQLERIPHHASAAQPSAL